MHTEGERRKEGREKGREKKGREGEREREGIKERRERGREDRRREEAQGRYAPEAEHGLSVMYCGVAGRTVLVCLQVFYYARLADCGVMGKSGRGGSLGTRLSEKKIRRGSGRLTKLESPLWKRFIVSLQRACEQEV